MKKYTLSENTPILNKDEIIIDVIKDMDSCNLTHVDLTCKEIARLATNRAEAEGWETRVYAPCTGMAIDRIVANNSLKGSGRWVERVMGGTNNLYRLVRINFTEKVDSEIHASATTPSDEIHASATTPSDEIHASASEDGKEIHVTAEALIETERALKYMQEEHKSLIQDHVDILEVAATQKKTIEGLQEQNRGYLDTMVERGNKVVALEKELDGLHSQLKDHVVMPTKTFLRKYMLESKVNLINCWNMLSIRLQQGMGNPDYKDMRLIVRADKWVLGLEELDFGDRQALVNMIMNRYIYILQAAILDDLEKQTAR